MTDPVSFACDAAGRICVARLHTNVYAYGYSFCAEAKDLFSKGWLFLHRLYAEPNTALIFAYNPESRSTLLWKAEWKQDVPGTFSLLEPVQLGCLDAEYATLADLQTAVASSEKIRLVGQPPQPAPSATSRQPLKIEAWRWTGRQPSGPSYWQPWKRCVSIRAGRWRSSAIPLPVFLINVRFERYVRSAGLFVTLLSFILTSSFIFALGVWLLLTLIEHARFFRLHTVHYPIIDRTRLSPWSERRTSSVLDRNRLKDDGLLPSYYPDCICGLFFHDENSLLSVRDWLLALTKNRLDDEGNAQLRIILSDDLSYYFVCVLINRDHAVRAEDADQGRHSGSAKVQVKSADFEIFDVIGTEFTDKFTVTPESRPAIEAFVWTARTAAGCAVCLGVDQRQILADVFIMRDFKLLKRSELNPRSYEYWVLRHHGHLA
jgi:hypothetical protein